MMALNVIASVYRIDCLLPPMNAVVEEQFSAASRKSISRNLDGGNKCGS